MNPTMANILLWHHVNRLSRPTKKELNEKSNIWQL